MQGQRARTRRGSRRWRSTWAARTASSSRDPPRARGWRAFVRGAAAELQRAGVPVRGARLRDHRRRPARRRAVVVGCARGRADAGDGRRSAASPSPTGSSWPRSARGSRTSGSARRPGCSTSSRRCCGEADRALRIDFRSLDVRAGARSSSAAAPWSRWTRATATRHAGSGYNERREECARGGRALGVSSLREATLERAAQLPEPLNRRARHVITENERVDAAVDALERRDMDELGRLLDASHASLRDDYRGLDPGGRGDAYERLPRRGRARRADRRRRVRRQRARAAPARRRGAGRGARGAARTRR